MSQKLKEKSLSPEVQASSISSRAAAAIADVSEFDERIQRVLHAAGDKTALEPTVLDLSGEEPVVLREGALTAAALEAALRRPIRRR